MSNLNYSSLLLGTDIPLESAQLVIHQPKLKEIGFLGDKDFYAGVFLLDFSKQSFNLQGKEQLKDKTDFELLMLLMNQKDENLKKTQICAQLVLLLLFPQFTLKIAPQALLFIKDKEVHRIDKTNYEQFREIIKQIFCLDQLRGDDKREYNPKGVLASQIAEKIRKGRQKISKLKGESDGDFSVIGRYVSVLAVGLKKDMNSYLNYTVFQLFDEYKRFIAYYQYDLFVRSKLAGGEGMQEPTNWMADIWNQQQKQDIKEKITRSTKRGTVVW